jgi:GNAT superfamily N-acetyltransferase
MVIRPLFSSEVFLAAQMLVATNDGLNPNALAEDLEECRVRWPGLQLGAFAADGLLAGTIAGRLDSVDFRLGWSDDIVVARQSRGQGTGHRLLEAQLEGFRELGCSRVRGRSPKRLFHSIPFFQRHGFLVLEETVARNVWGIQDGEPLWITERKL